jgi:hypothetical protein
VNAASQKRRAKRSRRREIRGSYILRWARWRGVTRIRIGTTVRMEITIIAMRGVRICTDVRSAGEWEWRGAYGTTAIYGETIGCEGDDYKGEKELEDAEA